MSQRGRGRASHGRAQKQTSSTHQQEQQLPHAQASTSSGAVRRPGQSTAQSVIYIMKY